MTKNMGIRPKQIKTSFAASLTLKYGFGDAGSIIIDNALHLDLAIVEWVVEGIWLGTFPTAPLVDLVGDGAGNAALLLLAVPKQTNDK